MKQKILDLLTIQSNLNYQEIWEDLGKPSMSAFDECMDELLRDKEISCDISKYPILYTVKED